MNSGGKRFHWFYRTLIVTIIFAGLNISIVKPARAANAVVGGACGEAEYNTALSSVQSSGGGTITFNCGSAPFYILFTTQKTITSTVTINGANLAILSGQNQTRLFWINNGASLTLKNLTVRNGNGSSGGFPHDGGAIYNQGSLTVDHSKFLYNTTTTSYSGGAIVTYGPLTIQNDSEFGYNDGGGGGAVYPRFGAAVTNISDSNFHHNRALSVGSGYGGALLAWDGPPVTVSNSIFDSNEANHSGGAAYILPNSSLAMQNSQLTNNQADNYGSGLYIGGTANITDTIMTGNYGSETGGGLYNAGTTNLVSTFLSLNRVHGSGGGIYNSASGLLTVQRSMFVQNRGFDGGGISAYGTASVLNSAFIGNHASYDYAVGGAISISGNVFVDFSTFLENYTDGSETDRGETFFVQNGASLVLKNSIIRSPNNDCYGTVNSQGYNVASDFSCSLNQTGDQPNTDSQLGLWFDGSGTPWQIMPLPGGSAVDSAQCGFVTSDMRGLSRPVGAACDKGALERRPSDPKAFIFLPITRR
jgi:hypothetical protein